MATEKKTKTRHPRPHPKTRLRRTTLSLAITAVALLAVAVAVTLVSNAATSQAQQVLPQPIATPATPVGSVPCGVRSTRPLRYQHVILIIMENHDIGQVIGSPNAPYLTSLADQCGSATNYSAVYNTSLPNYLGLTSGTAPGGQFAGRCDPITCNIDAPNIFSQLQHDSKTWRAYEESMPANCALFNSGRYAVRHNPVPYYTDLNPTCLVNDVPMGNTVAGPFMNDLTKNTLPNFSFVTPDLCHDTHDCAVPAGDAWLKLWVPLILSSPAYQSGSTVLFITYDEGHKSEVIPFVAVAPSIKAETTVTVPLNHYALLHTIQQMLDLAPYLGNADSAPSLREGFNF